MSRNLGRVSCVEVLRNHMRIHIAGLVLLALASLASAETPAGITKISSIVYDDLQTKSFLANYLALTPAQMIQADLAFADARAKMFPLGEKLKQTQTSLDKALTDGTPALQWKPLVTSIASLQGQILALECAALEKFRNILDGDQRHKLNELKPQPAPTANLSVEQ